MTAIAWVPGTNNFSSTGSWSPAQVPVAGDTVTVSGAGTLTMDGSTGRACASIDFTGFTGTLALTGSMILTLNGSLTLASGMSFSGSSTTFTFGNTSATITSNGKTFPGKITFTGPATFTLADTLTCSGLVTFNSSPVVNGTMALSGGLSMGSASVVTGTGGVTLSGTQTITGGTGTMTKDLTFNGTAFTFSGSVFNYKTGTMTYTAGTMDFGATPAVITITDSATLDLAGMPSLVTVAMPTVASSTLTLNSRLTLSGALTLPNNAMSFAGSGGWTCATLALAATWAARTYTFAAGVEYIVTTTFTTGTSAAPDTPKTTASSPMTWVSSSPGTKYKVTVQPGAALKCPFVNPTDCDSTNGAPIFSWGGVITTCFNWLNSWPSPQAPATSQLGM